jgi:hypothetical protein
MVKTLDGRHNLCFEFNFIGIQQVLVKIKVPTMFCLNLVAFLTFVRYLLLHNMDLNCGDLKSVNIVKQGLTVSGTKMVLGIA